MTALADRRRSGPRYAFDHVGVPARLVFYAGVFCVFAPFALVWDLASPKGLPWTTLAFWSCYSGATAVGWAYAFTRNLRYLWIHVPLTLVVPTLFGQAFYGRPGATGALLAQAVICLVVIILGYAAS